MGLSVRKKGVDENRFLSFQPWKKYMAGVITSLYRDTFEEHDDPIAKTGLQQLIEPLPKRCHSPK